MLLEFLPDVTSAKAAYSQSRNRLFEPYVLRNTFIGSKGGFF